MSAQPVHYGPEDPRDPQVILAGLPERERETFLRQYRDTVHTMADDLEGGYRRYQALLRHWAAAVIATNQPGYYEAMAEAKAGRGRTYDFFEAIEAEKARRPAIRS
jgi:hypothetical protein